MVEGQRRADHVRGSEQAQEQTIMALRDRAREHHPDIEVSDACWRQQVPAALGEHEQPVSIAAADLWLACGCAEGDSLALMRFEELLEKAVRQALRRVSSGEPVTDAVSDEMRQRVRIHLLVARHANTSTPDAVRGPRILDYRGRGSLAAWVGIIAARMCIDAWRTARTRPDAPSTPARCEAEHEDDSLLVREVPELEQMRAEARQIFVVALRQAFVSLTPRARNLLRQHHIDGVPLAALAGMYRVHESTVSRQLAAARAQLREGFERIALAKVGRQEELSELFALLRSRLDVSLRMLFRSPSPTEARASSVR